MLHFKRKWTVIPLYIPCVSRCLSLVCLVFFCYITCVLICMVASDCHKVSSKDFWDILDCERQIEAVWISKVLSIFMIFIKEHEMCMHVVSVLRVLFYSTCKKGIVNIFSNLFVRFSAVIVFKVSFFLRNKIFWQKSFV